MTLVITYWELIHAAAAEQDDINEAEHMFHQLFQLLQKTSEYSNTTGKTGNLFDVQLLPNEEGLRNLTLFSRRRTLLILPASLTAAYRLACALKVPLRRALSLPDPGGSCQP
ncbi:hypothetical protein JTE90_008621 [Oedothorax gibbosus]|uniref:Uncharacterized protein n=1 Tax=Oedothorax gibbosus TaxID=931172 RepID=A0AAV6U0W0_9ARAC|nr:hypothetical protein JTE90_008621 [Oedothorax gibbosus]